MKTRCESRELRILRSLNVRMNLDAKDGSYYFYLEKGYIGERKFDEWVEPLSRNNIFLNDLLLKHNNTIFQIDSLLLSSNTIYMFEVKNYEGDFFIEKDKWYTLLGKEIKNPLLQLQRNESLLRQLIQELGFNVTIKAYLIFINPDFHLYKAPLNLPIIFPTQLNRFINKIKKRPSHLKDSHSKLAKQLLSLHLEDIPYSQLPEYRYDELKKGIYCPICCTFYDHFSKTTLKCSSCGGTEDYQDAVLRSVEEYKLLFPDRKITTNHIYDWCDIIKDKRTIWRVLSNNFKQVGHGKTSHYVNTD